MQFLSDVSSLSHLSTQLPLFLFWLPQFEAVVMMAVTRFPACQLFDLSQYNGVGKVIHISMGVTSSGMIMRSAVLSGQSGTIYSPHAVKSTAPQAASFVKR